MICIKKYRCRPVHIFIPPPNPVPGQLARSYLVNYGAAILAGQLWSPPLPLPHPCSSAATCKFNKLPKAFINAAPHKSWHIKNAFVIKYIYTYFTINITFHAHIIVSKHTNWLRKFHPGHKCHSPHYIYSCQSIWPYLSEKFSLWRKTNIYISCDWEILLWRKVV